MRCWNCGLARTIDDNGCLTCDLCEGCTPAAGNCLDCVDMRREDEADKAIRYAIENEVCS